MTPSEQASLRALVEGATPFLRINGASSEEWCRKMADPNDGRIGPWSFVADFETVDAATWKRPGEVIYFVTDPEDAIRLVGQSSGKLAWRWKMVPMFDAYTRHALNRKALFHTSSWPAIEQGLRSDDPPPFTVSAIFRDKLQAICQAASGSLREALAKPETNTQRLSYHVESWVCALDFGSKPIWNKQKRPFA